MATETQKQTNSLVELIEGRLKQAQEDVTKTTLLLEKAKQITPFLPGLLLEQRWYTFHQLGVNKWYMETWDINASDADKIIEQLKIAGVHSIKARFKPWSQSWEYAGYFMAGNDEITIKIDGGNKPPNCRIEETREVKEVITYKAICNETEEEIK